MTATSTIRADTDQLRSVARQMRAIADGILAGSGVVAREMDSFAATWSGSARDRGMARWETILPRYQPDAERLTLFANELDALAARLDEAARVFEDAGSIAAPGPHGSESQSAAEKTWLDKGREQGRAVTAPTTMAGVFDAMQGKRNEKQPPDFQIYQVGENEFVVLLQGSDALQIGGMNPLLPNAGGAGLNISTPYTELIRERLAVLAGRHPNAKINLVGYSQGGLEAQNLAGDGSFWQRTGLEMASISTYGTPDSTKGYDPSKVTFDYDARGDIVSNYATPTGAMMIMGGLLSPNPAATIMTALKGVEAHTDDYMSDSSSSTRQAMEGGTPPWMKDNPNKEWVLYEAANDGEVTIKQVGAEAQKTLDEMSKTAAEVGQETGKQAGKALKAVAISQLPIPMRIAARLLL